MYAHEHQTLPNNNHGKNPSIETLLHYFMFESKLM
jgi:rhamnose utilization protein RhaD (predicted bifunctional aldolase and dehydrogenase)